MAKAVTPTDAPMKDFIRDVKNLIEKENASKSKIVTFSRLLKRVPGSKCLGETKFEVSLAQLGSRKKLHVQRIMFIRDIPWSIHMEPANLFSTVLTYNMVVTCYFPNAFCQDDSELHATIRFTGPPPISMVSKTQYFRLSQRRFLLPECLSANKLKMAKTNKRSLYEFNIAIELKEDRRKKHIAKLPVISFFQHTSLDGWTYMSDHLASSRIPVSKKLIQPHPKSALSALYNLLCEETMRLGTGESWFRMMNFVVSNLTKYLYRGTGTWESDTAKVEMQRYIRESGIYDHVLLKLMEADFSQGKWAPLVVELLVKLLLWVQVTDKTRDALLARFDRVSESIVRKITNRNSGSRLVSRLVLSVLPALYQTDSGGDRIVKFVNHLIDMNHFFNATNFLHLARRMDDGEEPNRALINSRSERAVDSFQTFYHKLILATITKGQLQELPIGTAKLFLRTVADNKINPFFETGSQALTFNNLTRLIGKHSGSELLEAWLTWIKENASKNPLLFDLVPADVDHEVPFTSDCGCVDYSPLDVATVMPLYHKIYTGYLEKVMLPITNAIYKRDISCDIATIEKIKEKGNKLHKDREFQLAIVEYDRAIDCLMVRKLRCREFEEEEEYLFNTENLLTICRSNRVSSGLELGDCHSALIDSTLVLRELNGMINGNEQNNWDGEESESEWEKLEKREAAARFKRVKALVLLKQWGPALQNVLEVLKNDQFREAAMPYYYQCLFKYMKEYRSVQYPHYCVICRDEDGVNFQYLKARCKDCKHPYCSPDCKKKDKVLHAKYCASLVTIRQRHSQQGE